VNYSFNFDFLSTYSSFFLEGLEVTLLLAVITVAAGTLLGILMALLRLSKFRLLRFIASAYIEFVRGTPLLVQLMIVRYGSVLLWPSLSRTPVFFFCAIAMAFNSTAYVAEIIRAGILAVDRGQTEAGRSLGLTQSQTMTRIILPQAVKNILPALGNEFVVIIKESSICSVVGLFDLMYMADMVRATASRPFEPLIVVALMYFCITFPLSKLVQYIEKRMRKGA